MTMNRNVVFTETVEMVTEVCCNCGTCFAFSKEFQSDLRNTGKHFYCPNGHEQRYQSLIKDLEAKLSHKEMELRAAKCETLAERQKREVLEVSAARLKRRISHGVCPCCKRTVKQLAAHMKTKHPDYVSA